MHQLALVPDSTQRIFADYNDLFIDELGKLPVMYSMIIDLDLRPVVRPAHRILVAM